MQLLFKLTGAKSADKVQNPASRLMTIDLTRYFNFKSMESGVLMNLDTLIATQPHVADEPSPTLPVPWCSSCLPGYPPGWFYLTSNNSMSLIIFLYSLLTIPLWVFRWRPSQGQVGLPPEKPSSLGLTLYAPVLGGGTMSCFAPRKEEINIFLISTIVLMLQGCLSLCIGVWLVWIIIV